MKGKKITVKGIVQGVFFRKHTQQTARSLGVKGFVRNEADGSVYIEAEGANLPEFIEWCKKGPQMARVTEILVEDLNEEKRFPDFEIQR